MKNLSLVALFLSLAVSVVAQTGKPIIATDYGVIADGSSDNTRSLQSAMSAATSTNGVLILPAGKIVIKSQINVGVQSAVTIKGQGNSVTEIIQRGGCNGLYFDLYSSGHPKDCVVNLIDFDVIADTVAANSAIYIDCGIVPLGSQETHKGSLVRSIQIGGGFWTNGLVMRNCWHTTVTDFYAFGNSSTYTSNSGPGSGRGIYVIAGVNNMFSHITTEFWSQGIALDDGPNNFAGCEGISFDGVQMVECTEGAHIYGGANDAASFVKFINWMVDNGNGFRAMHRGFVVDNVAEVVIADGEALMNGGDSSIILNNCPRARILGNSFEYRTNTTGPVIQYNGTTIGVITANNQNGVVQDNSSTIPVLTAASLSSTPMASVVAAINSTQCAQVGENAAHKTVPIKHGIVEE